MEARNKNKALIVVIVILSIIILAGAIIVWKVFSDLTTTKTSEEIINQANENVNSLLEEITDYTTLEQIANKINLLESMGPSNTEIGSEEYIYSFDNLDVADIPQQYKLYALVNLATNDFDYGKGLQSGYDLIRSKLNYDSSDETIDLTSAKIYYSFLEQQYNQLFGTSDLPKIDLIGEEYCPQLVADDDNEVFYAIGECGAMNGISIETYFATAKTSGDKVYADVYLAVIDSDNNVYRDIKQKELVESNANFTLYNSNYQKYGHYQYTFTRDNNNNYYFTNIKKIS